MESVLEARQNEVDKWRVEYKQMKVRELTMLHKYLESEIAQKRERKKHVDEHIARQHEIHVLSRGARVLREDMKEMSDANRFMQSNRCNAELTSMHKQAEEDARRRVSEREMRAARDVLQKELEEERRARIALEEAAERSRSLLRGEFIEQTRQIEANAKEDLSHYETKESVRVKEQSSRMAVALDSQKNQFEALLRSEKEKHERVLERQRNHFLNRLEKMRFHFSALKIQKCMVPWLMKVRTRRDQVKTKCEELLKTEEAFVGHLAFVEESYVVKLRQLIAEETLRGSGDDGGSSKTATPSSSSLESKSGLGADWDEDVAPLTFEEITTLFGQWSTLLKIHTRFLDSDLRPICKMVGSSAKATKLSEALMRLAESLKVPSGLYAANYEGKVLLLLQDLREARPLFKTFCDANMSSNGLTLKDLLIKPIQRPIHYKLFAKELARLQGGLLEDHAALRKATDAIDGLCKHTNKVVSQAKVQYIETLLQRCGNPVRLSVGDRFFVHEGEMWKGPVGRRSNLRYCYLLSDILIYTDRRKNNTSRSRTSSMLSFMGVDGESEASSPSRGRADSNSSSRRMSVSASPKHKLTVQGIMYLRDVIVDEKPGEPHFTIKCGTKEWFYEPNRDCNIDLTTAWLEKIKARVAAESARTDTDPFTPCVVERTAKDAGIKIYQASPLGAS